MHILILPSFYPEDSNANKGIFFKDQVKALSSWISKINVLYVEQKSLRELSFNNISKNYFQFTHVKEEKWDEFRIKGWKIPLTIGDYLWKHINLKLFKYYIKINGKPDIIHAHNVFNSGILASKISKKYNIPFMITEHDSDFIMYNYSQRKLKTASSIYENASKVLAVSNSLKKILENINPNLKVDVVPNIINPLYFLKSKNNNSNNNDRVNEKTKFISIGNLNKNKGHSYLLDSFSVVAQKKNISLKIIGEGPERSNLSMKIKKLDLQNKVELLGKKDSDEIYNNLIDSDCLVHSSYHETFGVVLVEALATGLPIISTKSGGPEDIYKKGLGYLVEKGDKKELSNAMFNFIENKNIFLKSEIRKHTMKLYSSRSICLKLNSIYNKIISN